MPREVVERPLEQRGPLATVRQKENAVLVSNLLSESGRRQRPGLSTAVHPCSKRDGDSACAV
jgi:hypothetical protein